MPTSVESPVRSRVTRKSVPIISMRTLIDQIISQTGVSRRAVTRVLRGFKSVTAENLKQSHAVRLPNFGTWYPLPIAERKIHSSLTGKTYTIPAGKRVSYSAGNLLKQAVKNQ